MRLPKLIYEVYPILYILIAFTTIIIEHSLIAYASGLVLALSSTVILFLRRNYRTMRQHLEPCETI